MAAEDRGSAFEADRENGRERNERQSDQPRSAATGLSQLGRLELADEKIDGTRINRCVQMAWDARWAEREEA